MLSTELPVGRELDDLIAVRVLGWHRQEIGRAVSTYVWVTKEGQVRSYDDWFPSTDMRDAWLVIESMTAICRTPSGVNTRFAFWFDKAHLWACSAPEAALEICQAAFRIIQESQEAGMNELARLSQEMGYD